MQFRFLMSNARCNPEGPSHAPLFLKQKKGCRGQWGIRGVRSSIKQSAAVHNSSQQARRRCGHSPPHEFHHGGIRILFKFGPVQHIDCSFCRPNKSRIKEVELHHLHVLANCHKSKGDELHENAAAPAPPPRPTSLAEICPATNP